MKYFLSLACLLLFIQTVTAQDFAEGYYVSMAQDTVPCLIKIGGKKISSNYSVLVIQGESDEPVVYKAKERKIAAYGFNIPDEKIDYRFVELEKTNDEGFFRQIDYGPKYQLYLRMVSTNVNGVVTTLPQYAIFNPDGTYYDLTTHLLGNWKKNLKKLLSDQPEALLALEEINRNQIPEFVERLNKQELSFAK
jgi:hypothetical protein